MKFHPHILLIGPVVEPVLASVSTRLARRDCTLVVLDFQRPAHEWPISVSCMGEGRSGVFQVGDRSFPLEAIRSTYVRMRNNPSKALKREDSLTQHPHHHALFNNFLGWLPGLIMNPNTAACTNGSKPYQQLLIAQLGFLVPKTLVTSSPQAAQDFYTTCQRRVIYKSISAERSVVKRLTDEDLDRLEQIYSCPVQFQEFIPGMDFRVHVVGERVFASGIETSSTDYRYVDTDGFRRIRAVELPPELEEKCVALAKGLGLVLAGIDLRRTMDGEYYCFEVNTSPAFNFYEHQTGQRIGEAVADLLYRGVVES